MTVRDALAQIRSSESQTWLVTGRRGLTGVVNLRTLERAAAENPDQQELSELTNASAFPHVHPDQGFDIALERMGANQP